MGILSEAELIAVLEKDPVWEKRRDAAGELARYSGATVLAALIHALQSDNNWVVRFCSADALGEIGDVSVLEALVRALSDEHHTVVQHATEALGKLGDPRAIDPLIETLRYKKDYAPVEAAHQALGAFGEAAVPRLLEKLSDIEIRTHVIYALALTKSNGAYDTLLEIATSADNTPAERIQAIYGLGRIGDARCVEALVGLLADITDVKMVDALKWTISKLAPNHEDIFREAEKRSLENYLINLKSIKPGMHSNAVSAIVGGTAVKIGSNIVYRTKYGEFQLIVSGDGNIARIIYIENVIQQVERTIKKLDSKN